MASDTSTSARTSIVVEAAVDKAFEVFTTDMAGWWPPEHHILQGPLQTMVLEPRAGGRIYDVGTDGSQCQWARVLVFDPPHRLVFSWDISLAWQVETDASATSEVEVQFIAESDTRTRVELEHRHLDRHGPGWEQMRDAISSPDGWGTGLRRYAAYTAGAPVA